jgi:hypothetical protein
MEPTHWSEIFSPFFSPVFETLTWHLFYCWSKTINRILEARKANIYTNVVANAWPRDRRKLQHDLWFGLKNHLHTFTADGPTFRYTTNCYSTGRQIYWIQHWSLYLANVEHKTNWVIASKQTQCRHNQIKSFWVHNRRQNRKLVHYLRNYWQHTIAAFKINNVLTFQWHF